MKIRKRHVFVDILAVISGGLFVSAVNQKSIMIGLFALLAGFVAISLDRLNIEDEEKEMHQ